MQRPRPTRHELSSTSKFLSLVKTGSALNPVELYLGENLTLSNIHDLCGAVTLPGCPSQLIVRTKPSKHIKQLIISLCVAMQQPNYLHDVTLHFTSLELKDDDVIFFAKVLQSPHCPHPFFLNLNNNHLTDVSLISFANKLSHQHCPRGVSLSLMGNIFTDFGLNQLNTALTTRPFRDGLNIYLTSAKNNFSKEAISHFTHNFKIREFSPKLYLHLISANIGSLAVADLRLGVQIMSIIDKNRFLSLAALASLSFILGFALRYATSKDVLKSIIAEVFPFNKELTSPRGTPFNKIFANNIYNYTFFNILENRKKLAESKLDSIKDKLALIGHRK